MNMAELLRRAALTFADRPAVSRGFEVRSSYRELADRAARLAGALVDQFGLGSGDRVALIMRNCPEYFEALFAVWHAGLAAVPVNAKLHAREFAYILDHSEAKLCFATPDLAATIEGLRDELEQLEAVIAVGEADYARLFAGEPAPLAPATSAADLAWLFYTSGTTGRPKGAMLSHRNLLAMVMNYFADVDQITERDCIVHAAPLSHGSGLYALAHVAKAANNVIPASGGFDPGETLALIAHYPATSFFFAPTMVHRLVDHPRAADTANLRTIAYGGGPMYVADSLKALDVLGDKLVQIYGQGEAPMTITGLSKSLHRMRDHPRYLERLGSAGIARTDVEVRVVDADDRDLPVGEIGEVICRGEVVMAGYWRDPAATAATLRGGWLHTGDLGCFDADGFLTLKDRSKDMIISGGTNIYPREIEEVLLGHPAVAEASVVGRPHRDWGEQVVAFVVAATGGAPTPAELDALCLQNIARFKRPRAYRFVDALPKNNYGKVLKTALRERLAGEDGE